MSDDDWNEDSVAPTSNRNWGEKPRENAGRQNDWGEKPRQNNRNDDDWNEKPKHNAGRHDDWGEKPRRNNRNDDDWGEKPSYNSGGGDGGQDDWGEKPRRNSRNDDDWGEKPRRNSRNDDDWGEKPRRNSRNDDDWGEKPRRNSRNDDDWNARPRSSGDNVESGVSADADKPKRMEYEYPDVPENVDELFSDMCISADDYHSKAEAVFVKQVEGNKCPEAVNSFAQFGFEPVLNENIKRMHYTKPTPIQSLTIPAILNERDFIACAETGSGKTGGFLLPIIDLILKRNNYLYSNSDSDAICEPEVLILSPTRELAIQTNLVAVRFCYETKIRPAVVYGGTTVSYQIQKMSEANIISGTTGRVKDFVLKRKKISLRRLKYFILDEADRMLDMGFKPDVDELFSECERQLGDNFAKLQCSMFSATFPTAIRNLASAYLKDYLYIAIGNSITGYANPDIVQKIIKTESKIEKQSAVVEILKKIKLKTLVFVETKFFCNLVATMLISQNLSVTNISGDREQREREIALREFTSNKKDILIATSVAARGLDIPGIQQVINYDLPRTGEDYVHRIGRTGRVGNKGVAISLYDPERDRGLRDDLIKILRGSGQEVPDFLEDNYGGGGGDGGGGGGFGGGGHSFQKSSYGGGSSYAQQNNKEDDEWDSAPPEAPKAPPPRHQSYGDNDDDDWGNDGAKKDSNEWVSASVKAAPSAGYRNSGRDDDDDIWEDPSTTVSKRDPRQDDWGSNNDRSKGWGGGGRENQSGNSYERDSSRRGGYGRGGYRNNSGRDDRDSRRGNDNNNWDDGKDEWDNNSSAVSSTSYSGRRNSNYGEGSNGGGGGGGGDRGGGFAAGSHDSWKDENSRDGGNSYRDDGGRKGSYSRGGGRGGRGGRGGFDRFSDRQPPRHLSEKRDFANKRSHGDDNGRRFASDESPKDRSWDNRSGRNEYSRAPPAPTQSVPVDDEEEW